VILDKERQIARVVFPEGTVDFALQEGATLEKDLGRRDFTVNAIAYNLHQQKLFDPLGGLKDLENGVLRMVSQANLEDDPLRLLRAYRQAAQLNFTIDPNTRKTICTLALSLHRIAAERVQTELNYLFTNPRGTKWLTAAWEDGLLQLWFAHVTKDKVDQLKVIDSIADYLPALPKNCHDWLILTKLATLVTQEPKKAELEVAKLKYSRYHLRGVVATVMHLSRLQTLTSPLSLREQYFFFKEVKDIFPILAARAIAVEIPQKIINPLIDNYLDPHSLVVYPQPLVTGHDLIKVLKIKPSPLIGKLLTEIQIAQIEGKIASAQEALQFAESLL
jgi:tRNA nucleotidyltransferase (CCA-adding enzyme)